MNRMRESPRRPIILKRRKLPFQTNDSNGHVDAPRPKATPTARTQSFLHGICIMDHPTMPDTQVVVIPKTADLQSVIGALTAKAKEHSPHGPNKFILLSGNCNLEDGKSPFSSAQLEAGMSLCRSSHTLCVGPEGCIPTDFLLDGSKSLKKETDCSPLDNSLTNIQWLGKMSTDVIDHETAGKGSNKENPQLQQPRYAEEEVSATKDTLSERPPYSYMAMIQFAINSKKTRKMTLKEIYNWIEDHFPYFRNVAKPGWKNSIRHNLSLHDMFVRESTPDGKTSYWTIRPEANRCLTLDQVYKPLVDPAVPPYSQATQVCDEQQQKRAMPDQKRVTPAGSTERKMKPLLPRTDSYLVPVQLPLTPSLFLPSSAPLPLSINQHNSYSASSTNGGGKRVRIAPKVSLSNSSSAKTCPPTHDEIKEEPVCAPVSSETHSALLTTGKRRETSSSRRKQRLVLPSSEEPVLLFSNSTFFDSGVVSDNSACQDTREAEPELQELQPEAQPESPSKIYTFKTPIKSSHPASSTPSKPPMAREPWKITPLGKSSHEVLDFSPIRTPNGPLLTPQRHEHMTFSFNSTPFKELPLFSSPCELLTCSRPSPLRNAPSCSRQLQVGSANRSLTEGLVLDTLNDSLSKILVDISFSGLEDDDLGMANISWSQLIPELK